MGLTTKELYRGCSSFGDNKKNKCGGSDDISSNGVKYIKVGEVAKGKYADNEVVVVSNIAEGASYNVEFFRILKRGNHFIFLGKHLDNYDKYLNEFIKRYFFSGTGTKIIDNKISIEELVYPDSMTGENDRQKFKKDKYARGFFSNAKLKPVFVHKEYGQVWMTDSIKALNQNPTEFELNSYIDAVSDYRKKYQDIFGSLGFYIKAPDGTAVAYKLEPDIFANEDEHNRSGVLGVVWNNGEKNKNTYEKNPSGCGAGDYVYDETLKINLDNDAVIVGKTEKGDNIYGYKNTTNPDFEKLYSDVYWVEDGKKKKSKEDFLKMNPKVFWTDYFGRILAFYRADIISPAECGKPVIYLYPEKPMNISVRVKLENGFSVTDPDHGSDGWKVFADTQSNIVNLADGKTYPYLFWEGQGGAPYKISSNGFVVAKNQLNSFFNDKLSRLGLIGKEINDFKEFWIPEMVKNNKPYYFVTFLSKRFMDVNAPLAIDPAPDTVIRVMMDYEELDQYKNVMPLKLHAPEREGFTVVEWGGILK